MTPDWPMEMQVQLERVTDALTEVIKNEVRGAEQRLSDRIDRRLQATEEQLSGQFTAAVEDVRGQVMLLGESSAGSLEAIHRRIDGLDVKFSSTLDLHAKVLIQHSNDINELKRAVRKAR